MEESTWEQVTKGNYLTDYTRDEWYEILTKGRPDIVGALKRSSKIPGQMLSYQAALLYRLVEEFNISGTQILEVGTYQGYSASIMSQAASMAQIHTINHALHEVDQAVINLKDYGNIAVWYCESSTWLKSEEKGIYSLIFVDGDHKHAERDLPWFNRLELGGLILFHDYTKRSAIHVVNAVDKLCAQLGRSPDVVCIDTDGIGMAGIYKRVGEEYVS